MNLRTGDILIWRSTGFYDTLSEITIGIKGLHAGLILVGDKFAELSCCGKSPSNAYVTFLIDRIFPIEEIVGHIWHRPNGAALYHIQRTQGPDIPTNLAYKIITEVFSMKKLPISYTIYIAVAAYFRMAGVAPSTGYENKRWQLCTLVIGYCLQRMGIIAEDGIINNLLPLDFYHLRFYQKFQYEFIEIFDKKTYSMEWLFTGLLIKLGQVVPEPVNNPIVDQILVDYDFPRFDRSKFQTSQDFSMI